MTEPRSFASLTSGLLARKGAARPAMRPQMQPLDWDEQNRLVFGDGFAAPDDDLGWNDMGHEPRALAIAADPEPAAAIVERAADEAPVARMAVPEVLRQIESLASVITRKAATRARAEQAGSASDHAAVQASGPRPRKLAFTLRLDAERHLRLRMACTLQNRSAQMVLVDALDRLLEAMPELDDLARHTRRNATNAV